eukprot:195118-Chlamydomonas_euryale.AAC.1
MHVACRAFIASHAESRRMRGRGCSCSRGVRRRAVKLLASLDTERVEVWAEVADWQPTLAQELFS